MLRYLTIHLLLALSVFSNAQLPVLAGGKIIRYEKFNSGFVTARNVDVWLPEGYSAKKKYAVLYMHDGQMLFDSATTWNKQEWMLDETMTNLLAEHKIRNTIVVAIWNAGAERHADYFPKKPFETLPSAFRDSLMMYDHKNNRASLFAKPVQSDAYLFFIVKELKPFIDSVYSTKKDRSNTFIAGSSMGGLISMYAVCEYPDIFGGAACLSTHWPGIFQTENNPIPTAFLTYLKLHLPDAAHHKFYFDYGTATLDAMYEPFQLKADSILKEKGYTGKNWMTRKFPGDDHSERSWSRRLHIPLEFLLH